MTRCSAWSASDLPSAHASRATVSYASATSPKNRGPGALMGGAGNARTLVGWSLARQSRLRAWIAASSANATLTSTCSALASSVAARAASTARRARASGSPSVAQRASETAASTSITGAPRGSGLGVVRRHNAAHEIVADDVSLAEHDARNALDARQDAHGLDQTRLLARRKIDLCGIAGDDHARAF